jgi:16S rRNA (guanine527-N7)-methyltransferase
MSLIENHIDYNFQEILNQLIPDNKIETYLDLLEEENEKVNIVSRETSRESLKILSAESILPLLYINQSKYNNYLDIGSGGGLPSIPLIMTKKISTSLLVERRKKKADVLKRIANKLGIDKNTDIINETVEDLRLTRKFDLITLRLVKLTSKLFNKIIPLLSAESILIYYSIPDKNIIPVNFKVESYYFPNESKSGNKSFTLISKN